MSIIIKEISIRTTIERKTNSTGDFDLKVAKLKKDILREVHDTLRKQRIKKGER
jgi:protein tyrosine phosphatase